MVKDPNLSDIFPLNMYINITVAPKYLINDVFFNEKLTSSRKFFEEYEQP